MADFRPETTVYLFRATAVDAQNQPFFLTEASKIAWYTAHDMLSFSDYSYQRENREYIRVNEKAENLRIYDMLAFQNSEGKYIFCHIETVEFVNPNCSEITYTIDYMQTYIENITFGKCWVEREMQIGDWNGTDPSFRNLQPEGIETGKMQRKEILKGESEYTNFELVVFSAYDGTGEPTYNVRTFGNYPTGLNAIRFPLNEYGSIAGLNAMLTNYAEKGIDLSRAIAGMVVMPAPYADGLKPYIKDLTVPHPWPSIDGYEVINAKCFTSEFFRLEIGNRQGNIQELKLENFQAVDDPELRMIGHAGSGAGGTILYPKGYEGHDMDFGVIRYDDIQAPFVGNTYASWLAGHSSQLAASVIGDITSGAIAGLSIAATGGASAVGALASTNRSFNSVMQTFAKITDNAKDPAGIGGQVAGNVLDLVLQNYGFSINWVYPYIPNLRAIDQYFSRFGYRTNLYKVPNVNTRPKWNYVKTAGAVVRGPFSSRARQYIENSMDQGVTFWHLSPGEELTHDWDPAENKE